jgi:hypothetical protein
MPADFLITADARARRASRTWRMLILLRRAMVITTLAVVVTSFATWQGVQDAAETVRDRTSPAIIAVTSAKTALIRADQAAVRSFDSGEVVLSGPGDDYQNQTALAGQNLARAAELNEAGSPASRTLQIVEALLTEYTGAVEQADVHYRQPGGTVLGIADLWNASRLLRSQPDGVLVRLDEFAAAERDALDKQLSQRWTHPLIPVVWLTPAAFLLALLVRTQWTLRKRFRRRVNPPMLLATVGLAAVIAGMSWTFVVARDLRDTRAALEEVVAGRISQAQAAEVTQGREIRAMLDAVCGHSGHCGPTVASLSASSEPASFPSEGEISADTDRASESAMDATGARWLEFATPLAGLAIGALALAGLQPRIDEYRYRS